MRQVANVAVLAVVLGVMFAVAGGAATAPVLLKDVNTTATSAGGTASSYSWWPPSFTALGASRVVFAADDGVDGIELWVTDGTAAGTALVKDIKTGSQGSNPSSLCAYNGLVLFSAGTASDGYELWQTDGTAAGTVEIKNIAPQWNSSSPSGLTVVNGKVVFSADDGSHGAELWVTDGTAANTTLLVDINPGSGASAPSNFVAVSSSLVLFTADDGSHGVELWRTDGTAAGTALVADIASGSTSSSPSAFATVGGYAYFTANDGVHGGELWRSDGTAAGTTLVADINPGAAGSSIAQMVAGATRVFFVANDGSHGAELWTCSGTTASLLKDVYPGATGSSIASLYANGDRALFAANDNVHGLELWTSDGTAAGTVFTGDIWPSGSSSPQGMVAFGTTYFFSAANPYPNYEPWTWKPNSGAPALLAEINPSTSTGSTPRYLTAFPSGLYFFADDGTHGQEPWIVPATAPTVATAAVITPNPVTGTTASASVLGDSYLGELTLTYTWHAVGAAPAAVGFAPNGTNVAKTATATFQAAGSYTIACDITDTAGRTTTSSVSVVVNATPSSATVSPATATVVSGTTHSFTAALVDQFGATIAQQPTWSCPAAAGTITTGGVFTAGTTAGTYAVTASFGAVTASASVTVRVNAAPVVSAGANQTITLPATASLSGTATDDGLPTGTLTVQWTAVNPPASVSFANATATTTTASFAAAGTYTLRLTASDGQLSASSDVVVTVQPTNAPNQPPTVSAGGPQTTTVGATLTLHGSATDDGIPGPLSVTWSTVSGPDTVSFDTANAAVTDAHFATVGTYVVQLSASDTALTTTSQATITVLAANAPPSAPSIMPQPGSYFDGVAVTVTPGQTSETCWYNVSPDSGSELPDPTPNGTNATQVSGPIPLTQSGLVKAIAVNTNGTSSVARAHYDILDGAGFGLGRDGNGLPDGSPVSPYCFEFHLPSSEVEASVTADNALVQDVRIIGPHQAYANVPLDVGTSTTIGVSITGTGGGQPKTETHAMTWTPTDLVGRSSADAPLIIRRGDSLLFTVSTGAAFAIDSGVSGSVASPVPAAALVPTRYDTVGDYIARALDGTTEIGSMHIQVVDVPFDTTEFAAEVGYARQMHVTMHALDSFGSVAFTPGDSTSLVVLVSSEAYENATLTVQPLSIDHPVLLARIGANGPIIGTRPITAFTLHVVDNAVLVGLPTQTNNGRGGLSGILMDPYLPDAYLDLSINSGPTQTYTFLRPIVSPEGNGHLVGACSFNVIAPTDATQITWSALPRLYRLADNPQYPGQYAYQVVGLGDQRTVPLSRIVSFQSANAASPDETNSNAAVPLIVTKGVTPVTTPATGHYTCPATVQVTVDPDNPKLAARVHVVDSTAFAQSTYALSSAGVSPYTLSHLIETNNPADPAYGGSGGSLLLMDYPLGDAVLGSYHPGYQILSATFGMNLGPWTSVDSIAGMRVNGHEVHYYDFPSNRQALGNAIPVPPPGQPPETITYTTTTTQEGPNTHTVTRGSVNGLTLVVNDSMSTTPVEESLGADGAAHLFVTLLPPQDPKLTNPDPHPTFLVFGRAETFNQEFEMVWTLPVQQYQLTIDYQYPPRPWLWMYLNVDGAIIVSGHGPNDVISPTSGVALNTHTTTVSMGGSSGTATSSFNFGTYNVASSNGGTVALTRSTTRVQPVDGAGTALFADGSLTGSDDLNHFSYVGQSLARPFLKDDEFDLSVAIGSFTHVEHNVLLAPGLGRPDALTAAVEAIPGHASVALTRGNLYWSGVVADIASDRLAPSLVLSYNSKDDIDCGWGRGWRTNYDMRHYIGTSTSPAPLPQQSVIIDETGTRVSFQNRNVVNYAPWPGARVVFQSEDSDTAAQYAMASDESSLLIRHDNRVYYFDQDGWLKRIRDVSGDELRIERSGGRLSRIVASNGAVLDVPPIGSPDSGHLLHAVDAGASGHWTFDSFDSDGNPHVITVAARSTADVAHRYEFDFDSNDRPTHVRATGVNGPFETVITYPEVYTSGPFTVTAPDGGISTYTCDRTSDLWYQLTDAVGIVHHRTQAILTRGLDREWIGNSTFGSPNWWAGAGMREATQFVYDEVGNVVSDSTYLDATTGITTTRAFVSVNGGAIPAEATNLLGEERVHAVDGIATGAPADLVTTYTYGSGGANAGRVVAVEDATGGTTTSMYDANGNLTQRTDANGSVWTFADFTSLGQPQTITAPTSSNSSVPRITTCTYRDDGRLASSTDVPTGITTHVLYDGIDAIGSQRADLPPEQVTLDALGREIVSQTIDRPVVTTTRDAVGRPIQIATDGEEPVVIAYQTLADGIDETATQGTRRLWHRKCDLIGRASFDTALRNLTPGMAGSTPSECRTDYVYDPVFGWLNEIHDQRGGIVTLQHDIAGRVASVTSAEHALTTYRYNGLGWLLSVTDPDGRVSSQLYAPDGQVRATTDPSGNSTEVRFAANGQPAAVVPPIGTPTRYEYDTDGSLLATTSAIGVRTVQQDDGLVVTRYVEHGAQRVQQTQATIGSRGYVTAIDSPTGHVGIDRYADGGAQQITAPGGRITTIGRDGFGRTASTSATARIDGAVRMLTSTVHRDPISGDAIGSTDAFGHLTVSGVDSATGETQSIGDNAYAPQPDQTTPLGTVLQRDTNGNVTQYADALGASVTQTFDLDNRLKTRTEANGVTTSWDSSPGGFVRSITRGDVVTTFTPDANGRTAQATASDGTLLAATIYDRNGRVTVSTHGTLSTTYGFDPVTGLLRTVTAPGGRVTAYDYDSYGRRTSMTDPEHHTTTYGYDDLDRMTSVQYSDGTSESLTFDGKGDPSLYIDRANRGETLTYDEGGVLATRHLNDTNEDITTTLATNPAGGLVQSESYAGDTVTRTTDLRGRLATLKAGSDTVAFGYDAADHQTARGPTAYDIDTAKSRVMTVRSADGSITCGCEYDASGRLHIERYNNGLVRQRDYDGLGRLATITESLPGLSPRIWSCAYDANSRIAHETLPDGTADYTYDDAGRLAEERRDGAVQRWTTYAWDGNDNRTVLSSASGAIIGYVQPLPDGTPPANIVPQSGTWTDAQNQLHVDATGIGVAQFTPQINASTYLLPRLTGVLHVDQSALTATVGPLVGFGFGGSPAGHYVAVAEERLVSDFDVHPQVRVLVRWLPTNGTPSDVAVTDWVDVGGDVLMEFSRLPANRVHVVVRDALTSAVAGDAWASATTDITGALTLEALPADGAGAVSATYAQLTWWSATNLDVGVSTYGSMNQLLRTDWTRATGSSSEQFAYDAAQNLLSRTTYVNGIAQGGDGYVHDRLNRLAQVNHGGAFTSSVFHGASAMRASTTAPDGTVTTYLNDGANVIASTTHNVTSTYGYFGGRPLFSLSSAGAIAYSNDLHGDAAGHVSSDGVGGVNWTTLFSYDAFGNTSASQRNPDGTYSVGNSSSGPRYRGLWSDGEGLYKTQTRTYDPTTGRFTSIDPARAGTNWYAYCGGDPVNRSDPSGLDWVWNDPPGEWQWDGHYAGAPLSEDAALEAGLFPPEIRGDAPGTAMMFPRDFNGHPYVGANFADYTAALGTLLGAQAEGNYSGLFGASYDIASKLSELKDQRAAAMGGEGWQAHDAALQFAALDQLQGYAHDLGEQTQKTVAAAEAQARASAEALAQQMRMEQEEGLVDIAPDVLFAAEAVPGLARSGLAVGRGALRLGGDALGGAARVGGAFARGWAEGGGAFVPEGVTNIGVTYQLGQIAQRARSGLRAISQGAAYEARIRALYPAVADSELDYIAIVNGRPVRGVADAVASQATGTVGIEAKFVRDWGKSIFNPASPVGSKWFAARVRGSVLRQATKYSNFFSKVVYHTNSPEFVAEYSKVFADAGLTNIQFIVTP